MTSPVLTYRVLTDPDPLEASPSSGDSSTATLTIEVTNQTSGVIACTSISFHFLAGTGAKEFCEHIKGFGNTTPEGWSIAQDGNVFTATPATPKAGKIGNKSLTFTLTNIKVNQQPGSTDMTITEIVGPVRKVGKLVVTLTKFPPSFQVNDFKASPANVKEGESTTLFWHGSSNANYELEYVGINETITIKHPKGEPKKLLPARGSYTIEKLKTVGKAKTEIVFTLTARSSGKDFQRQVAVTILPASPKIEFFESTLLSLSGSSPEVTVKWNASHAAHCTLTGNDGQLNTTATDHVINLKPKDPADKRLTLTAWDLDENSDSLDLIINWRLREVRSVSTQMRFGLAVSTDGERVYVLGSELIDTTFKASLSVFDSLTLESIGSPTPINVNSDYVGYKASLEIVYGFSIAVSRVRQRIYSIASLTLRVHDANTMQQIPAPHSLGIEDAALVAISRDHSKVYVIGADLAPDYRPAAYLRIVDAVKLNPIGDLILLEIAVTCMATSPLNEHIYLGCFDNTLRIFDVETKQFVGDPTRLPATPTAVAVSADGNFIYLSFTDNTLRALDAENFAACGDPVTLDGLPTGIAASPSGDYLFITNVERHLRKFTAYSAHNPVKIKSFTASPARIEAGDDNHSFPVRLDWETVSASEVLLDGKVTKETTATVNVDKTTQFTLEARGSGGPVRTPLTVTVRRPVKIESFTASPGAVAQSGTNVTLNWAVLNADSVTVNGEAVEGNSKIVPVRPDANTFTLEATGWNGSVSAELSLIIIDLVVSRSGDTITATFRADPGDYLVRFGFDREDRYVHVRVVAGDETASASVALPRGRSYRGVDVAVNGIPGGPAIARLNF